MEWSKLDAGLHAALDDVVTVDEDTSNPVSVFVRFREGADPWLRPSWKATRLTDEFYTMSLGLSELEELSEWSSVERITLTNLATPTSTPSGPQMGPPVRPHRRHRPPDRPTADD